VESGVCEMARCALRRLYRLVRCMKGARGEIVVYFRYSDGSVNGVWATPLAHFCMLSNTQLSSNALFVHYVP
jgi:hypothetical protein